MPNQQIRAALERDLTIDITTTGRKSGQPRRMEIWHRRVGDRFYVTGTPGRRDWLLITSPSPWPLSLGEGNVFYYFSI